MLTVHGGDVFGLGGRLLARFKRAALEAADIVTVNSSATERAVLAWRLLFVVSSVSLWGVDLRRRTRMRSRNYGERHRRGGGPLLAFAGRLVEEKGVGDVLRAVAQLTRELPDVTAVLAGAGQDRPAFERLAVELGVADRVTFLGWLAPETVPLLFAASDAVLAPSRTGVDGWKEAQGLAVAEALAAGRPVIASNVGGLPDHVIDGLTGLLVPEGTPAAVADAVRRLAADQQLAGRLGDAGRDHALRHLTRASTAARFRELYQGADNPVTERP